MKYECMKCNDVVKSSPIRWDMKYCSCGSLGVDNHNPPDDTHRVIGDFKQIKRFGSNKSMASGEEE